ncbi:MAG: LEA type 2 family protein [Myxococcaceae bacterium]|jgi:LEA14-like dessication related protein|nr:LEA type 2 family protein [Myxococcaceae bacterium]
MPTVTRVTTLALALSFAACKSAPETRAEVKPPELPRQELLVVSQTLTDVTVKLTGELLGGDEALAIDAAEVEFVVDGTVLSTKRAPLSLRLTAGQSAPFEFEESFTYVKSADDLKAMDARGGSLLIALRGNLIGTVQREVEVNGKAEVQAVAVELPFARSREVRTPRLPHLKLGEAEAGRFAKNEVNAVFHLHVVNPNPFPITLSSITYRVTMAGKMVAEGEQGVGIKTAVSATDVFDVSASMTEATHGKEVEKLIKGLVVPYELQGELKTALYSEPLSAKGEFKLKASKE